MVGYGALLEAVQRSAALRPRGGEGLSPSRRAALEKGGDEACRPFGLRAGLPFLCALALLCFVLAASLLPARPAYADSASVGGDSYRKDSIIVVYASEHKARAGMRSLDAKGARSAQILAVGSNDTAVVKVELSGSVGVEEAIERFEADDSVAYAQPNYLYRLVGSMKSSQESPSASEGTSPVNDPYANVFDDNASVPNQWYLKSIGAFGAWEFAKTEGTQTVAVFDTGINFEHNDLKNVIDKSRARQFSYDDSLTTVVESEYTVSETDWDYEHGSHVAGIIAAEANNNAHFAGVSYNAKILPVKVFFDYYDDQEGSWEVVTDDAILIAAYQYLFKLVDAGAKDIHVVNMSLGGSDYDRLFEDTLTRAKNDYGILSVCAAGNDGSSLKSYPSDYEVCTAVTAVNSKDYCPSWSDHNDSKDIAAPGVNIWSCSINSEDWDVCMDGTSMAAPVVAGVAALMWAASPQLTVDEVQQVLYNTATDLGKEGYDEYFGHGKVNAAAALREVSQSNIVTEDVVYTGRPVLFAVHVTDDEGMYLTEGMDYSIAYFDAAGQAVSEPVNAGEYSARVVGMGSYEGKIERTVRFNILPVDVSSDKVTVQAVSACSYTGSPVEPAVEILFSGGKLVQGTDFEVAFSNNVGVTDAARAVVSGKGNFSGETEALFSISPRSLSEAVIEPVANQVYQGSPITPSVVVKVGDKVLARGIDADYRVAYWGNVNAGTATVVVFGLGNYCDTVSTSFQIVPRGISEESIEVSPVPEQRYTGQGIEPSLEVTDMLCGKTLEEGKDYELSYRDNVQPGTATVVVSGLGNYSLSREVRFTIAKKAAPTGSDVVRLAGSAAYQTSARISKEAFSEGSEWVIIARDDDFRDAMSATGLAGALNAPILLTDRNGLNDATVVELQRLGAKKAYVVGGPVAMPGDFETQLTRDLGLDFAQRVYGNSASDTSVECAKLIVDIDAQNGVEQGRFAIVAMSDNFQDALSMSSFAYKYHVPIFLLSSSDSAAGRVLGDEATSMLTTGAYASSKVFVPGGTGAVPNESVASLGRSEDAGILVRLWGNSGYDTSNQIALYLVGEHLLSGSSAVIASGAAASNGSDALSGASLAGRVDGPILLVNGNESMGEPCSLVVLSGGDSRGGESFAEKYASSADSVYALGGSYVMPQSVLDSAAALLR